MEDALRVPASSVASLLGAAGISLLGFTMPIPLLPELRHHFNLDPSKVGLILSSFASGMFFSVMVLPGLSDRQGRKPVMVVAHFFSAVLFMLQGLAITLNLSFSRFLMVRFLTGICAGCNPIFKAYLADVVPASRVPQFMIYRESAATCAFIIGPVLGGLLTCSVFGIAGPLYATALAHLVTSLLVALKVDESLELNAVKPPTTPDSEGGRGIRKETIRWPLVGLILLISFLYVVSQNIFSGYFSLLMSDRFNASPRETGLLTTEISVICLFFQVACYAPLLRWCGIELTGALGAVAMFLGLAGLGSVVSFLSVKFWVSCGLYALGVATLPATVPSLLAEAVPKSHRGFALGIDSVLNNLCRIVAPIGLGILYAMGPSFCFTGGGSTLLAVAVLLALRWRFKRRHPAAGVLP